MDAQCFYWPMLVFFQIGFGPLNKTVSPYEQPIIVLMHHCIFVHAECVCASDREQRIVGYVDGQRGRNVRCLFHACYESSVVLFVSRMVWVSQ